MAGKIKTNPSNLSFMTKKVLWIYLSECIGTALLVGVGLSVVILDNGAGSPVETWIPDAGARRALTGFLFGTTGCLITLSPVGKISGAHINPIVSLAFRFKQRMSTRHTVGYIIAQLTGSVIGASPLLLWGRMGDSIRYGATIPLPSAPIAAFIGEVVTSFLLIALIFFFTGHKKLRRFTPYMIPPLYCLMVWLEAPLSGTSTNPARSLGPAVISGIWTGYGLYYWIAPITGAMLAVLLFRMPFLWKWRIVLPKLYHRPS
ncbi:MAG TPA: MIP/aquaporin family protein [Puia sp.]|jgi:aquaporin Z